MQWRWDTYYLLTTLNNDIGDHHFPPFRPSPAVNINAGKSEGHRKPDAIVARKWQ